MFVYQCVIYIYKAFRRGKIPIKKSPGIVSPRIRKLLKLILIHSFQLIQSQFKLLFTKCVK